MKQFVSWIGAVCFSVSVRAQSKTLFLATDKTTSLIFPYSIKHVDRGTRNVLVEPVKEADNILLVKAACKDFPQTNLSVVTSDGSVYCFEVFYGDSATRVYRFAGHEEPPVSSYANGILNNPRTVRGIKDRSWDMIARVIGIYIRDQVIYYQLQLDNESTIDYDIDFLRFFLRDKEERRRTAVQETELTPLYTAGNVSQVKAGSRSSVVVALDKFTIPDQKHLVVEIGEKNGGRHLLLRLGNKKIIKARLLSGLQ